MVLRRTRILKLVGKKREMEFVTRVDYSGSLLPVIITVFICYVKKSLEKSDGKLKKNAPLPPACCWVEKIESVEETSTLRVWSSVSYEASCIIYYLKTVQELAVLHSKRLMVNFETNESHQEERGFEAKNHRPILPLRGCTKALQ